MKIVGYRVSHKIVVDHPELRSESFAPVAPGTYCMVVRMFDKQSDAVRYYDYLVRGEDDFASEYVAMVDVARMYDGRSPAWVRMRVRRARGEAWRRES